MKKGDKVRITNPDSSFYNKKGKIVGIRIAEEVNLYRVSIKGKGIFTFTQYDIEKIRR